MGTWDKGEGTKKKDDTPTISEERNANNEKRKADRVWGAGYEEMGYEVMGYEVMGYEVWGLGIKEKEQRKRMEPLPLTRNEM